MNNRIGRWCVVLAAMTGCANAPQQPGEKPLVLATNSAEPPKAAVADSPYAPDRVIATIAQGAYQRQVTMDQLLKPLMESHGLNTLLIVVQLELARGLADRAGIKVTEADITAERESTLSKLFSENDARLDDMIENAGKIKNESLVEKLKKQKLEDRDLLLRQFMEQQRISPSEFDLVMTTNVYLRKVAEPQVASQIKEEDVRREFAIKFNEKLKARHIQFKRAQDAGEALRRLKEGQTFEQVARDLSTNPTTAALGGELPPFSRDDSRLPQNFKDVAFALQDGEISNLVESDGTYHLIKAEHRIAPKAVKFEDVEPGLRRDLSERVTQAVVTRIRADIGTVARTAMKINDPELDRQFKAKIKSFEDQQTAAEKARLDLEKDRLKGSPTTAPFNAGTQSDIGPKAGPAPAFGETTPDTRPATEPAAAPAADPANATRPIGPATQPVGSPK